TYLGLGMVGGRLASFDLQGEKAAELALRVLDGEKAGTIPVIDGAGAFAFDWRQLRRWGLSERQLPPGSIIRYRELSFWARHRSTVSLYTSLLLALSGLGYALWLQRRHRRSEQHRALLTRLERLIAELAGTLADAPCEHVDDKIRQSLPRV